MLDNENIMTAKASEVVQKVPTDEEDCIIERCYNWPMMSFIQSGRETRIYRTFSDNKLDGMYVA